MSKCHTARTIITFYLNPISLNPNKVWNSSFSQYLSSRQRMVFKKFSSSQLLLTYVILTMMKAMVKFIHVLWFTSVTPTHTYRPFSPAHTYGSANSIYSMSNALSAIYMYIDWGCSTVNCNPNFLLAKTICFHKGVINICLSYFYDLFIFLSQNARWGVVGVFDYLVWLYCLILLIMNTVLLDALQGWSLSLERQFYWVITCKVRAKGSPPVNTGSP